MEQTKLSRMIEKLRCQMIELAAEKGNLMDENVIEISQQLDKLLLQFQKLKETRYFSRERKKSA
jgi:hypothetical protein